MLNEFADSPYAQTHADLAFTKYQKPAIRFIDLFAGLGGTRIGFEQACNELKLESHCVFTSEIKTSALEAYKLNFNDNHIEGDITLIDPKKIPDFDYLLAGFPCQPFSSAGKRQGFLDQRGGLFFTILKILDQKRPAGFLLENVEGLEKHDNGETLKLILQELNKLGYNTNYSVLDASHFGVPQRRKRIYITGHLTHTIDYTGFKSSYKKVADIIEHDAEVKLSAFTLLLFNKFKPEELYGQAIKDKRGGQNNIHSWELELKGKISLEQKQLLSEILKKRRYKKWAEMKGIVWMDGMPLTFNEISSFYTSPHLQDMLDDLTKKGYLTFEHPKDIVLDNGIKMRKPAIHVPKGYNIVAGKLSFPFTKILDPKDIAPTLVATEAGKLGISTPKGVRKITVREGLRLSGFPESYNLDMLAYNDAFDLIGNTVMPPVIKEISKRLLK
jgi:DNA (cytosine-5)-methyltransferase 1